MKNHLYDAFKMHCIMVRLSKVNANRGIKLMNTEDFLQIYDDKVKSIAKVDELIKQSNLLNKKAEEIKLYFDSALSFGRSYERFWKYAESMKTLSSKVKWLEIIDLAATLYDGYTKLPQAKNYRNMDISYAEFLMKNGRYDLPNEEEAIDIDDPEWETVINNNVSLGKKYILQKSLKLDGYARIVQIKYRDNVRIAHGQFDAMLEKLKRLSRPKFYRPGDIIYIDREDVHVPTEALKKYLREHADAEQMSLPIPAYAHVGIYIGKGEVIHFAGEKDVIGKKTVHITTVENFINSHNTSKCERDIYVMHFPENGKMPYKLYQDTSNLDRHPAHIEFFKKNLFKNVKYYSPEDTIARAKKIMASGEYGHYHMIEHNCEHFAFYCKTGKKISPQVDNVNELADIAMTVLQYAKKELVVSLELCKLLKKRYCSSNDKNEFGEV